jgi:hypothetical protein
MPPEARALLSDRVSRLVICDDAQIAGTAGRR